MENTYKMAWARALVEHSCHNPQVKDIHFDQLASFIFGYYWNQTIWFNLEQSPNPHKRATIHQLVIDKAKQFRREYGSKPIPFLKAKDVRRQGNLDFL